MGLEFEGDGLGESFGLEERVRFLGGIRICEFLGLDEGFYGGWFWENGEGKIGWLNYGGRIDFNGNSCR